MRIGTASLFRALCLGVLGAGAAYSLSDRASAQSAADRYPDRLGLKAE
jgi:hypothetical protein